MSKGHNNNSNNSNDNNDNNNNNNNNTLLNPDEFTEVYPRVANHIPVLQRC